MSSGKVRVMDAQSWYQTDKAAEADLCARLGTADAKGVPWDGVLAIYTDRVAWTTGKGFDTDRLPRLLELRAYNQAGELHAVRDVLGSEFSLRTVCDDAGPMDGPAYDAHFDDVQYLDIDATRSAGHDYTTTGGGRYRLPIEGARQVVLRNYIHYGQDDGMALIVDFRIVRLVKGGSDA